MDAKQYSNQIKRYKGERIFPEAPSSLSKEGVAEWDRLVGSLFITEKDIGSLIIACQSFEMYVDLYDAVTTEIWVDKAGKNRKRKISIAEYCKDRSAQQQVELVNMNKALDNYNKVVKRLTENNALTAAAEGDESTSEKEQELMNQLFFDKKSV